MTQTGQPAIRDYHLENWVWDRNSKPAEVLLSSTHEAAYFYIDPIIESTGTVAVRVSILPGKDKESWGLSYKGFIWHNGISKRYCDPFYERSTVIGVLLNRYKGTLSFFKNGVSLGEAFNGLNAVKEPLYPMISSSATQTELELGARTCRYVTLQEKCFSKIRNSLQDTDSIDNLPLPRLMKLHLKML
uniref:B30.2/SPRY domain-containing protein n=1 Tax=Biomphalaria glabrata TaxID=6526 RepID=A0A2C9JFQ0_BIOGL